MLLFESHFPRLTKHWFLYYFIRLCHPHRSFLLLSWLELRSKEVSLEDIWLLHLKRCNCISFNNGWEEKESILVSVAQIKTHQRSHPRVRRIHRPSQNPGSHQDYLSMLTLSQQKRWVRLNRLKSLYSRSFPQNIKRIGSIFTRSDPASYQLLTMYDRMWKKQYQLCGR